MSNAEICAILSKCVYVNQIKDIDYFMNRNSFRKYIISLLALTAVIFAACFVFYIPSKALTTEEFKALIKRGADEKRKFLIVSKDAQTGAYATIGEAVEAAKNRDIIIVLPGEYDESVNMADKELILVGWDKETTVITHEASNYLFPVINASSGEISNLTLYCYFNPDTLPDLSTFYPELKDEDPYLFASYFPAYVIHLDDNHMYKSSMVISNCNIISEQNYCIGIGLRNHCSVAINNCFVYAPSGSGCLFIHDPDRVEVGHDMNVLIQGSTFSSGNKTVLKLQSVRPENRVNLTFIGNEFIDKVSDPSEYFMIENDPIVTEHLGFMGSGAFYLTENSMLNNVDMLNVAALLPPIAIDTPEASSETGISIDATLSSDDFFTSNEP
mgnify:CR=1 FL=1